MAKQSETTKPEPAINYPTIAAWQAEARRRFGDDPLKWRFVCPVCKHEASVADWKAAGATEGEVAFSCVGRRIPGSKEAFANDEKPGPCTYTGGGLFKLNPVRIGDRPQTTLFNFAPDPRKAPTAAGGSDVKA